MYREFLLDYYSGTSVNISNILKAQDIARACLDHMNGFLKPGMTREDIHSECERFMKEKGADNWWIHNDPALILFGSLSTYSAHESPDPLFEGKTLQLNDLITIDVAPGIGTGWGDMARTFVMEDGRIVSWEKCQNEEIKERMEMEVKLHELFKESLNDEITFSELHEIINEYLQANGYYNCDYHGNFGHTIENDQKDRVTIDKGVDIVIAKYNKPLTFEPHICKKDGKYGIKHENMYVYIDKKISEL